MFKHVCILGLVLSIFAALSAPAAEQAKKPQDAKALMVELRLKSWNKELNFTEEQKEKIRPLIAAENAQVEKLRADQSLSVTDRDAKQKAIQQETYAKITPILNEEQAAKWKEMVARFSKKKTPPAKAAEQPTAK